MGCFVSPFRPRRANSDASMTTLRPINPENPACDRPINPMPSCTSCTSPVVVAALNQEPRCRAMVSAGRPPKRSIMPSSGGYRLCPQRGQCRMREQSFHPVHRSDPGDGSRRDLRSRKADRLSVAVVENDVLRCKIDV